MSDTSRYSSPEIADIGSAAEVTEDITTPVAEGYGGSGKYYDASKSDREEEAPEEGGDSSSSDGTQA
jgi:hypothetical protein